MVVVNVKLTVTSIPSASSKAVPTVTLLTADFAVAAAVLAYHANVLFVCVIYG